MSPDITPADGEAVEQRGSAAAFFDVDRTLIRGSANFPLAVAAFRAGLMTPKELLSDAANVLTFTLQGASDERSLALQERILRGVRGELQSDVVALCEEFIPRLADRVIPATRALLEEHAARGEDRIIVSASPQELVERLADALGLEGAVGTRAEVEDGRYTGRLAGAFCYGEGKAVEVRRLAGEHGYDLRRSFAYSDAASDLPLLEAVGRPVAVNPDRELRTVAKRSDWPIVEARVTLGLERRVLAVGRSVARVAADAGRGVWRTASRQRST